MDTGAGREALELVLSEDSEDVSVPQLAKKAIEIKKSDNQIRIMASNFSRKVD